MMISTIAENGVLGSNTFSLVVYINGKKVVTLVDSGSTNSFVDYEFAVQAECSLSYTKPMKVTVARGGQLQTDAMVDSLSYMAQDYHFQDCFKLLKVGTYRLILGADWIYMYSPISLDLQQSWNN